MRAQPDTMRGDTHGGMGHRRLGVALLLLLPALLAASLSLALVATASAAPGRPAQTAPHVDVIPFDREVDAASARYMEDALSTAQRDGSSLIVISLDTPGGDLDSMHAIVEAELASTVPIVVYVSPPGAHAGSAGTFLALAAPLVAMAPDTSIGAASPVDITGENLPSTLDTKIKDDLVSLVDNLQNTFHRNLADAEQTVTAARSFTEAQAVGADLVNMEADSQSALLSEVDGQGVTLANGHSVVISAVGLPLRQLQPTLAIQVEEVFLDPNVLFFLFVIAAVCLFLELTHPGAIVPGTIGAIVLVLFLFGSQALNPNWTGLILMLLGIVLLAIDLRVPTHGVLSAGALVSMGLGAFIFFDTGVDHAAQPLSPWVIGGFMVGVGLIALVVLRFALRSARSRTTAGTPGLIGQRAVALSALAPAGRVRVVGEDWAAELDALATAAEQPVPKDGAVIVVAVRGLTLIVKPVEG